MPSWQTWIVRSIDRSHPQLADHGIDYSYLLMQSRQFALGHRYSVPMEVQGVLESLPLDTLAAIADYASRLPDPSSTDPGVGHEGRQKRRPDDI